MITKTNFKDMLKTLGFTTEGNTFQKSIGEADLKVDFGKKEIIYPEDKGLKFNERQTCNFSQNENKTCLNFSNFWSKLTLALQINKSAFCLIFGYFYGTILLLTDLSDRVESIILMLNDEY